MVSSFSADRFLNVSDSNAKELGSWKYSTGIRISFTLLFSIVVALGTCGNSLVIVAVKWKKVSQTSTNFLLANLAVADITTLLFGIPDAIMLFVVRNHPGGAIGTILCKFITFGTVTLVTSVASVLTLLLISWERYWAIVRPLREGTFLKLTKKGTKHAVIGLWLIAVVFGLPVIVGASFSKEKMECVWEMDYNGKRVYIFFFLVMFYIFPVLILSYSYFGIVRAIYSDQVVNPGGLSREEDLRSRLKIVKTLIIVTVVFIVCLGVFGTFWLMFYQDLISDVVFRVAVLFLFLNAAVNPLIYTWQSTSYRAAFKQLCLSCS